MIFQSSATVTYYVRTVRSTLKNQQMSKKYYYYSDIFERVSQEFIKNIVNAFPSSTF